MRSRTASADSSLPGVIGHPKVENRLYDSAMRRVLKHHPSSLCSAVDRIEVEAARRGPHQLTLEYLLIGNLDALSLAPAATPRRGDKLWQSSCFEAFLCEYPGKAYCEFNFAPSLQWAAYRFDGYRNAMRAIEDFEAPRIEATLDKRVYKLSVSLNLDGLLDLPTDADWYLGLSVVIEEKNGRMSYWALNHPSGKPDFHHADCFRLRLPSKGGA